MPISKVEAKVMTSCPVKDNRFVLLDFSALYFETEIYGYGREDYSTVALFTCPACGGTHQIYN